MLVHQVEDATLWCRMGETVAWCMAVGQKWEPGPEPAAWRTVAPCMLAGEPSERPRRVVGNTLAVSAETLAVLAGILP
jgi:hypothetical protein